MSRLAQTQRNAELTALIGFGCIGAFVGLVLFAAMSAGCESSASHAAFHAVNRHTTPDLCVTAQVVPAPAPREPKAEGLGVPPDAAASSLPAK